MLSNSSLSCLCCSPNAKVVNRRSFLGMSLVGLGLSPLLWHPQTAIVASPRAKALVLSCIDYRFIGPEQQFLSQTLAGQYDWVSLAGASLALAGFPHLEETKTFWDQLDLSRQLHQIEKVIILDHQDCGAYASKVDINLSQDPKREYQVHQEYLTKAYDAIHKHDPTLAVELYFVTLRSEFQAVPTTKNA